MQFLVNIDIDDLEKAKNFYTSAFGLKVGRRFGSAGIELLGGPAPVYLLAKAAGTSPAPGAVQTRSYERHWTPVHLDFVVPDIEAAIQAAAKAGARIEQPVSVLEWGKLALMADPFGHGLCLIEFSGRGYDELIE